MAGFFGSILSDEGVSVWGLYGGDRIFQICDEEKNVVEVLAYRRNMKNRDTLPQEDPS